MNIKSSIVSWLQTLRFPVLLGATFLVFVVNVLVPDVIPLVDEILLALGTVIISRIKKRPRSRRPGDKDGS